MAQVPELNLPSVGQSANQLPQQRLDTPAAAFGANVTAEALGNLGQVLESRGANLHQQALQFQAIDNKARADEASVKTAMAIDEAKRAFQESNPGLAASANLPTFYKSLETIRTEAGSGLSPLAQAQFTASSRQYVASAMSSTSAWAQSQRVTHIAQVATDSNAVAASAYAQDPDNPASEANLVKTVAENAATLSKLNGWDEVSAKAYMQQSLGAAYQGAVATAINTGDIPKANELFSKYREMMTADQIKSVYGSLRVGNDSFDANSKRQAWVNGDVAALAGSTGVSMGPNAPRGLRNNNPLNVTNLGGDQKWAGQTGSDGPYAKFETQQDGWNAADKNLAAYGSRHGIDTLTGVINRWAPPNENNTAAYVATVAAATGIKPAQKIDLGNPQLRQKLLTAMAAVENGHPVVPQGKPILPFTIPRAENYTDPQQFLADSGATLRKYVDLKYKDNPTQGAKVQSSIHAGIMLQVEQMTASQRGTYYRLADAVQSGDIEDESALATAYPGASKDLAALAPQYTLGLQSDMKRNANDITPERQSNMLAIQGMVATDPQRFATVNLSSVDLPRNTRLALMKQQETVKGKITKDVNQNTALRSALSSVQAKSTLSSLDIKANTPEYFQFAGALDAKLDAWTSANKGKVPDQKVLNQMITEVSATVGRKPGPFGGSFLGDPGRPAFLIPEEDHQKIVEALTEEGLNPSESAITQRYWMIKNAK